MNHPMFSALGSRRSIYAMLSQASDFSLPATSAFWYPGQQVRTRSHELFTVASVYHGCPQLLGVSVPNDNMGIHPYCSSLDIVGIN